MEKSNGGETVEIEARSGDTIGRGDFWMGERGRRKEGGEVLGPGGFDSDRGGTKRSESNGKSPSLRSALFPFDSGRPPSARERMDGGAVPADGPARRTAPGGGPPQDSRLPSLVRPPSSTPLRSMSVLQVRRPGGGQSRYGLDSPLFTAHLYPFHSTFTPSTDPECNPNSPWTRTLAIPSLFVSRLKVKWILG